MARNYSTSIEADLSWFFLEAESDLGFGSNFSAMVAPLVIGVLDANHSMSADPEDFYTDARLRATAKLRRIDRIYSKLDPAAKRTLTAYFCEKASPAPVRVFYSCTLELLEMTPTARSYKNPRFAVQSALKNKSREVAKKIETEARYMFKQAIDQYREVAMKESREKR